MLIAILGEVDEDTTVMGTHELQRHLRIALASLTREHAAIVEAPLTVTGGLAEFAGVLRSVAPVYTVARALAEACHPLSVRVAAAAGGIDRGRDTHDVERMDGPALDAAAELLYRARKEGRFLSVQIGDAVVDPLLNALLSLQQRWTDHWTDRQREVVALYRELGTQAAVARRLAVSQQSVSHTLAGAGWKRVREVELALENALGELGRRG